jgi:sugar phosphate isomerase/epimerase
MELACTPGIVVDKKYKMFNEYIQAGFQYAHFDLRLCCNEYSIENREEIYEKNIKDLKKEKNIIFLPLEPERMAEHVDFYLKECRFRNIKNIIGTAPTMPIKTERTDSDELIYKLTVESIKVCSTAGCKSIIIYPKIKRSSLPEDVETNRGFYLQFAECAIENNIKILIKNDYDVKNGHYVRGCLSDVYRLREFVDKLNESVGREVYGVYFDIGVCNILSQDIYEYSIILGRRIKAISLRENDGIIDSEMLPFTCVMNKKPRMNWMSVIRGLRKIEFDGAIICDFDDTHFTASHLIRPALIQYEKKVADFIVWQLEIEKNIKKYDKRVLFGAGNMCRNYMKCYGEEFKPLFTCDNDESIWGTYFEGLEVKSPESLKELPDDCAIFICNTYYSEITQQLRDMGIKNPIEYFNDEYMPSLYLDRYDSFRREVR